MLSTITLTFDLSYTNPLTGALEPRGIVTDTTDYAALGLDLENFSAKGLGVISFNGDIIEDFNTVGSPMIDLENWETLHPGEAPVFYFSIVTDGNGNAANGIYSLQYSLRLLSNPLPGGVEIFAEIPPNNVETDGSDWLVQFLVAGNAMTLVTGSPNLPVTVVSSSQGTNGALIVVAQTLDPENPHSDIAFDITNLQANAAYNFKGCNQAEACVDFTYDCEYGDSGTWGVTNETQLGTGEVVTSLACTITYPGWTFSTPGFTPSITTTSLPYPSPGTETPLATGTYTVAMSQVVQKTQTDGLIIQYTSSTTKEFPVTCAGTLCGLVPCIENLRAAHESELKANRVSKYQVYIDNVAMYYLQAVNYKACGELDKYKETIVLIKAQLDASGCECTCCDGETYYWVSNNSGQSVIDQLLTTIQYRLFDGIPGGTQDETAGVQVGAIWQDFNTGKEYRCSNPAAGVAVWDIYYDPTLAIAADDVSFDPNPLILGTNVQDAIDNTLSLTASLDSQIGNLSTQIGILVTEVNSKVASVTGTMVDNTDPLNPVVDVQTASDTPFTPNPALGLADTVQEAVDAAATLALSKVTSVVGLNTNNSDPENPVIGISVDGTTITGAGTPASPLQANFSLPYKSFVAEIISGTSIGVMQNNIGATISATNTITGVWTYTATAAVFTSGKTWVSFTPRSGNPNQPRTTWVVRGGNSEILLWNYINGVLSNTDVDGYIEIRIYP